MNMKFNLLFNTQFEIFQFNDKRFSRQEFFDGSYVWYEYNFFTESYSSTESETYTETKGYEKETLEKYYQSWIHGHEVIN